jgi:predicted RNA-binding Zn ribbon-like protein
MLDAPPSVTTGQLIAARDLREAIYRTAIAVINGIALPQGDVATLNLCAAAPPPRPALRLDRTIAWSATDPIGAAVALLSRDAIKLLAGRQAARLRECAQPDCSLLFIDTSRSSGRRWCAMGSCGNREKVRRYRQRAQRASRDGQ